MIKRYAVVALIFLAPFLLAAEGGRKGRSDEPIKIKSNELFTDNSSRTATFAGKVSARQGELTIFSDKLVITYAEKERDVEKVEAFGNVRVVQGSRQAVAGHAVYENKAGKIVLDTAPKVFQGEDVITGKVITYFVDEQKSVVTGGSDTRVEAVIYPGEKGRNGSGKP